MLPTTTDRPLPYQRADVVQVVAPRSLATALTALTQMAQACRAGAPLTAVGLLFAGGAEFTFADKLHHVLDALDINLHV